MKNFLVTGGYGFIGSHFIKQQINDNFVVNLDKLTYCANLDNLELIANHKNYIFVKGDIQNADLVLKF